MGNYQASIEKIIPETWQYIWSLQFPFKRSFTYDFELYELKHRKVDILVAVK